MVRLHHRARVCHQEKSHLLTVRLQHSTQHNLHMYISELHTKSCRIINCIKYARCITRNSSRRMLHKYNSFVALFSASDELWMFSCSTVATGSLCSSFCTFSVYMLSHMYTIALTVCIPNDMVMQWIHVQYI